MKYLTVLLLLSSMLSLTGCETTDPPTYPITGEQCSPDDPVHQLGVDCTAPV